MGCKQCKNDRDECDLAAALAQGNYARRESNRETLSAKCIGYHSTVSGVFIAESKQEREVLH